MAIKSYITPFEIVHRRVVPFSAQALGYTAGSKPNHYIGAWVQGMWVTLKDGAAQLDESAVLDVSINGGVIFDIKPSFSASEFPERTTIIAQPGWIFDVDDACFDGDFTEGYGATAVDGKWTAAGESDTVLAIVERIPDNNNGNLRLKLQFEGTPVGTPVS